MKSMKKTASLLLALLMVFALTTSAFAKDVTVGDGSGTATLTVSNAAKGVSYSIYKLFDATVTGAENGSIAYTGTIPKDLMDYFEEDAEGNITAIEAAKDTANEKLLSAAAVAAITAWANDPQTAPLAADVADGSELVFTGLPYGLYVVTTTQGSAITVDSTNPNAVVVDKNTTEPSVEKLVNGKEEDNVSIGDKVTYTATFNTANWLKDNEGKYHKVVQYVIDDTLPAFLSDVTVTSLKVDVDGDVGTTSDQKILTVEQFVDKKITIDWTLDGTYAGDHLYDNNAKILLTYTATVTSTIEVDGPIGNVNTVTLTAIVDDDEDGEKPKPWENRWKDKAAIFTYAALLKKVDENKAPLAGAKFAIKGLTVDGVPGNYVVKSYDRAENADFGTVMETDDLGALYISGLDINAGEVDTAAPDIVFTVKEIEAPAGYNKLVDTITMEAQVIGKEARSSSTVTYYDADGNVTEEKTDTVSYKTTYDVAFDAVAIKVENKAGAQLPSTGGMGTTIFYVLGVALMLGAVIALITKRRMNA